MTRAGLIAGRMNPPARQPGESIFANRVAPDGELYPADLPGGSPSADPGMVRSTPQGPEPLADPRPTNPAEHYDYYQPASDRRARTGLMAQSDDPWRFLATPDAPAGMISIGNIDLYSRPSVKNADGTTSSVRSISFESEGKEVLIPTVSDDGKILSDDEAIELFERTGKHLGIFDSPETANEYARQLHEQQDDIKSNRMKLTPEQASKSGAMAFR